jgi:hypothetical protein
MAGRVHPVQGHDVSNWTLQGAQPVDAREFRRSLAEVARSRHVLNGDQNTVTVLTWH